MSTFGLVLIVIGHIAVFGLLAIGFNTWRDIYKK